MFCDTEIKNRCLLHDNDEIFYVDNNHLSKAGNEKILRVVLDKLEKIELKNQKRPSISSLLFNFILLEAGSFGNPGIVIIEPHITTINLAPDERITSLTCKVWPEGAPFNFGSIEKLY